MGGVKTKEITVTTEATGTTSKSLRQYLNKKKNSHTGALHTAESACVKIQNIQHGK
jgi:hypothetical protein